MAYGNASSCFNFKNENTHFMQNGISSSRAAAVESLLAEYNSAATDTKKTAAPRIPALTRDELQSEKGIPYVKKYGPKLKFKGKGFEAEDLNKLCMFYKDWAHQLAPKLTFTAFLSKVDKMCRERSMRHYWDGLAGRNEIANRNLVNDDYDDNTIQKDISGIDKSDIMNMGGIYEGVSQRRIVVETDASFGFEDIVNPVSLTQDVSEKTPQSDVEPEEDEDEDDELLMSIFSK